MKLRRFGTLRAAVLLSSVACCTAASAVEVNYQYYRFTPIKLRDDALANSIQLSEFNFLRAGAPVDQSTVTISNPGGNTPAAEAVAKLIDGATNTKWLDFHKNPVVFDFGAPTAVDAYRFTTANDAIERDPVRWTLEGSNDGAAWTLIDHLTTDFATPTTRTTVTTDIALPATVVPATRTWTGSASADWNASALNWNNGAPVAWDNATFDLARFTATGPTTVTLTEPISVRAIEFTQPGYLIQGNTLTLKGVTRLNTAADAEISSTIAGNVGLVKLGSGKLTLSGNNTFTGNNGPAGSVTVRGGELVVTGTNVYGNKTNVVGGTLTYSGAGKNATIGTLTVGDVAGKGWLNIRDTASLVFNGTPAIGTGAGGVGTVRQSGGSVTYGQDGSYLTVGNGAGGYGSYFLSGGTIGTGTGAGVRVGWNSPGVFNQSGGAITSNRWFAIGGPGSTGITTFTGGTMTLHGSYRFVVGDQAGGVGVINLGTAAGGTAVLTPLRTATAAGDGSIALGNPVGSTGQLNLNSGVLKLSARIYQGSGSGTVVLNGGTLQAGLANVELLNNTPVARIYKGGVTIDTAGFDASISHNLASASGNGIYLPGGTLAVPANEGGSGYYGPPLVIVSTDGGGTGAMAVANVANGVVTGVTMTAPGEGYQAGDHITFNFVSGGTTEEAFPLDHTLTAAEVAPNNTGTLTKSGAGTLTLTGSPTYTGPTQVAAGTLRASALGATAITVSSGATLTGNLATQGPVTVQGTFAPGQAVGLATGTGALNFAPGSTYAVQLADWNGAAGTGYDTANFNSVATTATAGGKLTIAIDGTGLTGFTESAKSFVIASGSSAPTGFTAGNYQVTTTNFPGTGTWSLAPVGNTLVLSYATGTPSGYAGYMAGFSGLADTTPTGDPDGDGIPNLLEYVLKGNPAVSSTAVLPKGSLSGGSFVLTFVRQASSKADTTQIAEFSTDLATWTGVSIPAATGGGVTVTPDTPAAGMETVTVTSPVAPANGRVFGRLRAVK